MTIYLIMDTCYDSSVERVLPRGILSHILSFNDSSEKREREGLKLRAKWNLLSGFSQWNFDILLDNIMADFEDETPEGQKHWHKVIRRRKISLQKEKKKFCMQEIRFEKRNSGKNYPLLSKLWR